VETYILSTNHYQIELLTNLDQVPEAGALVVVSFPKPKGDLVFRRGYLQFCLSRNAAGEVPGTARDSRAGLFSRFCVNLQAWSSSRFDDDNVLRIRNQSESRGARTRPRIRATDRDRRRR
jgi:hypothetical protein